MFLSKNMDNYPKIIPVILSDPEHCLWLRSLPYIADVKSKGTDPDCTSVQSGQTHGLSPMQNC